MNDLHIRTAEARDAKHMCKVLNPIIEAGGTTAHRRAFDPVRMRNEYVAPAKLISCFVAALGSRCVGFQSLVRLSPDECELPGTWGAIATFVSPSTQGSGTGGKLFAATRAAAIEAGLSAINAAIRSDNASGLAYYSRMGFTDYSTRRSVVLSDGLVVDQVCKRFDL